MSTQFHNSRRWLSVRLRYKLKVFDCKEDTSAQICSIPHTKRLSSVTRNDFRNRTHTYRQATEWTDIEVN